MTTLEMARTFLEPGLLDPDLATLLGIFAASNATEPVQKAEALLVLHQARHIVGMRRAPAPAPCMRWSSPWLTA